MKELKSKIKKFDKKLKKHIKRKDFVKIYRKGIEGDADIHGFILQINKDFLLIQVEEEFTLNGYVIIRKDSFDSIRLSETEIFQRKILDKEGILKSDYGINAEINIESWSTIFKDLRQKDYFAIVECEDLKTPAFAIGEISKTSNKSVGIRYFSPQGIIDEKTTKIKYKEITLVKFDNLYTKMYRKYLREENS